jgi:hypothetical protein
VSVEMLLNFPIKISFFNTTGRCLLFCSLVLVLCIIIVVTMYLFFAGWLGRHFVCLLWRKG